MIFGHSRLALGMLLGSTAAMASAAGGGGEDSVVCYQNGKLVFETQDRVRDFASAEDMVRLAEISLGQVEDRRVTLYGATRGGLACFVTTRE